MDSSFLSDALSVEATREQLAKVLKAKGSAALLPKSLPPYTGLENQGGTCYLSSLIQSLFATERLRKAVFGWRYDAETHGPLSECMAAQLQQLFARLALTESAAASTVGLTTSFGWSGAEVFVQHDVQELCRVMFEALERTEGAVASGSTASEPLASVVRTCFNGRLQDSITCCSCGKARKREDVFADLELAVRSSSTAVAPSAATAKAEAGTSSAPPPPPLELDEALRSYLAPERLEGDNAVTCDSCGVKGASIKQLSLTSLPPYLMLHLKRFAFVFEGGQGRYVKLTDPVRVPLSVNMASFASHEEEKKKEAKEDDVFDLYAVLMHSGTVSSGHYYAFVRLPSVSSPSVGDTSVSSFSWLCFNDSHVSTLSSAEVAAALSLEGGEQKQGGKGGHEGSGSTPLAKPQFGENAPVNIDDADAMAAFASAANGGGKKSSSSSVPRSGTPYLLCYARRQGASSSNNNTNSSADDSSSSASPAALSLSQAGYARLLGAELLPREITASIAEENLAMSAVRKAYQARSRLAEVHVTLPQQCLLAAQQMAGIASSSSDYASSSSSGLAFSLPSSISFFAPVDATLETVGDCAYSLWAHRLAAAAGGFAGGAAASLKLPSRWDVRLRRYEPGSRLRLDTYSSPTALASTLASAGLTGTAHLLLEVRPPSRSQQPTVSPMPLSNEASPPSPSPSSVVELMTALQAFQNHATSCIAASPSSSLSSKEEYESSHHVRWADHEFDPSAVTLRIYRWSKELRQRLEKGHAEHLASMSSASSEGSSGQPHHDSEEAAIAAAMAASLADQGTGNVVASSSVPVPLAAAEELESVEITFPGSTVNTLTVDSLSVAIACHPAASSLAIPVILQRLTLGRGGLPYLHITDSESPPSSSSSSASSGGRASGMPVFLSGLSPDSLLLKDLGICSGDAIVVEVAGEEEPEAEMSAEAASAGGAGESSTSSPAFALLKRICTADAVTIHCNLLVPQGVELTAHELLHLTGGTSAASTSDGKTGQDEEKLKIGPAHEDTKEDGETKAEDAKGQSNRAAVMAAAERAAKDQGMDLSSLDAETKAAILEGLIADLGLDKPGGLSMDSRGFGGGAQSQSQSAAASKKKKAGSEGPDPTETISYCIRVAARRTDTLASVKKRLVDACNAAVAQLLKARTTAGSEPDPSVPLLQLDQVHLRRGPKTPMYREGSTSENDSSSTSLSNLRLVDLDIGDGSCLFLAHGGPLAVDEVQVHPVAAVAVAVSGSAGSAGSAGAAAVYHVPLPKFTVRFGTRVSALRRQVLAHVRTALERLPQTLAAGAKTAEEGASSSLPGDYRLLAPAGTALSPLHLKLRVKNLPPPTHLQSILMPLTQAAGADAKGKGGPQKVSFASSSTAVTTAPSLSSYSLTLNSDVQVKACLSTVVKNVAAAASAAGLNISSGGAAAGAVGSADAFELLVEVTQEPLEDLTGEDTVVLLREFKPGASGDGGAGGGAGAVTAAERLAKMKSYGRVTKPAAKTPASSAGGAGSADGPTLGGTSELIIRKGSTCADLCGLIARQAGLVAAGSDSSPALPLVRVSKALSYTTAENAAAQAWYVLPAPRPFRYEEENLKAAVARSQLQQQAFTCVVSKPSDLLPAVGVGAEGSSSSSSSADWVPPSGPAVTARPLQLKDGIILLWRRDPAPPVDSTEAAMEGGGASRAASGTTTAAPAKPAVASRFGAAGGRLAIRPGFGGSGASATMAATDAGDGVMVVVAGPKKSAATSMGGGDGLVIKGKGGGMGSLVMNDKERQE